MKVKENNALYMKQQWTMDYRLWTSLLIVNYKY